MAAPSLVGADHETAWLSTTNPKSPTAWSPSSGNILAAVGITEDNTTGQLALTVGPTWTAQTALAVNQYTWLRSWTATAAGGSITPVFTRSGGSNDGQFGGDILEFSGSSGIGASARTNVSSGAPSLSITTTQDDSAVLVIVGDWNAGDGSSRTWRTAGTAVAEQAYQRDSSHMTVYVGLYPNVGVAGAKTVGLSAPSTQKYSILALEIKGTAGATQQEATGTAALTVASTGAATARTSATGTAAVTLTTAAAATARTSATGTSAITTGAAGAATAQSAATGTAALTSTAAGAATARVVASGTAAAALTATGTATAQTAATGTADLTVSAAGTATARLETTGTAATNITAAAAATVRTETSATAAVVVTATGSATVPGTVQASGTSTITATAAGAATALTVAAGTATITVSATGTASTGSTTPIAAFGIATLVIRITGTATVSGLQLTSSPAVGHATAPHVGAASRPRATTATPSIGHARLTGVSP